MTRYSNRNGNSNIEAYEIGDDYIEIKFFGTWKTYRYSYASAGADNIETAKRLARQGYGLNSFIMRHMRFSYER